VRAMEICLSLSAFVCPKQRGSKLSDARPECPNTQQPTRLSIALKRVKTRSRTYVVRVTPCSFSNANEGLLNRRVSFSCHRESETLGVSVA
jgi:hypothetical protein